MSADGTPRSSGAPEEESRPPDHDGPSGGGAGAGASGASARQALERRQGAEALLNGLPSAALVLRADGEVLFRNAVATALETVWLDTPGQRLQRLGQLGPVAIGKLLDLSAGPVARPAAVAQRIDARLHRSTAQIVPIDGVPALASIWPNAHVLLLLEAPRETVLHEWLEQFGKHHRLTKAEMRVLSMLVEGEDLPRIAVRAGIAYSTVRTHMRMLLEKTGATRQGELLTTVLRN